MAEQLRSPGSAAGPARTPTTPTTPLGAVVDVFRVRQYFNALVAMIDLSDAVIEDAGFLGEVRRAALPLPFDRHAKAEAVFTDRSEGVVGPGPGRLGLVATGGSGALAAIVGVVRALEECGGSISVYSLCSGAALFGFPLAAGLCSAEVAELVMGLRPDNYVDVSWRDMARAVTSLGRGWSGIARGDKLERYYRQHLGDRTLGQLTTPAYAPIWNVETNQLDYLGPRTHPDLPVARAIRMAVSLPLFLQAVLLDGGYWCDGGIVDIFPVRPILEIEEPVDAVVAVNGFYPPGFAGEDETGWDESRASIIRIARQVRTCQQVELARQNLARLRASTDVELLEPVPYQDVRGTGFYRQFLTNSDWPEFMRAGRAAMLAALQRRDGAWGRDR